MVNATSGHERVKNLPLFQRRIIENWTGIKTGDGNSVIFSGKLWR